MSEYERLMAYFKIAYEDLSVLHHNVAGEGFFEAHEHLDTLYGLIAGFSDEIIERGIARVSRRRSLSLATIFCR